jgi:hypothetical protein
MFSLCMSDRIPSRLWTTDEKPVEVMTGKEVADASPPGPGLIAVDLRVELTREQWAKVLRHVGIRNMSCSIGLDDVHVGDFVLFQAAKAAIRAGVAGK